MASAVKVALIAIVKSHYIEGSLAPPEERKTLQNVLRETYRIDEEITQCIGARISELMTQSGCTCSAQFVSQGVRSSFLLAAPFWIARSLPAVSLGTRAISGISSSTRRPATRQTAKPGRDAIHYIHDPGVIVVI